MAKAGRRYPLVIYTRMIDRWWPAILTLSLALLALAWAVSHTLLGQIQSWRWQGLAGLGGLAALVSMMMLAIHKSAYVQPFSDHLRLATPFLRLNISYKRLQRTTAANMSALFPPKSMSGWRREIIQPLGKKTAVVIELNSHPMSPAALRLFLSPFFFKDATPHFVILVDDWMRFNTELESLRVSSEVPGQPRGQSQSILSRLPKR